MAGGTFDVTEFGARGDGSTVDSDAVNAAIHAAAEAGGGTVRFPAGTYLSYSIRLRSNIALHLAPGATIRAAEPADGRAYDPPEPGSDNGYKDFGHSHWHNSLIWGDGLENVSIVGGGVIDGRGLRFADAPGERRGNKAIALKLCRNVLLRDITIVRGGHFAILATGVDNLRIEGLLIDTNRDGIDVDCCRNVRISNCTVNSPNDDAIVFKSSYALGQVRDVDDVTVTGCLVNGYDVGSVVDGSYTTNTSLADDQEPPTGRVKFGTESVGGFKNVVISDIVFDRCRGIALETVDGGTVENVVISNVVMRHTSNAPLFLRIGSRLRAPEETAVGSMRNISISDLMVHDADPRQPMIIAGLPGHPVENVRIRNARIVFRGGLSLDDATTQPSRYVNTFFVPSTGPRSNPYDVPERAADYPEPCIFGVLPAYALYVRHAAQIRLTDVDVEFAEDDTRPAVVLDDVAGARLHLVTAQVSDGTQPFVLRDVTDFSER